MVFKCSLRGKKFKTISLELETQLSQQLSWYIVIDANKSDVHIILVSCESNIGSITYQVNRYDKLCPQSITQYENMEFGELQEETRYNLESSDLMSLFSLESDSLWPLYGLDSTSSTRLCVKVIVQIIRQKKGRSKRRKKYIDEEFSINDRLFLVALLMYTVAYQLIS